MKKILSIIGINIFIFFIAFFSIEYYLYKKSEKYSVKKYPFILMVRDLQARTPEEHYDMLENSGYSESGAEFFDPRFRKPVGIEYKNKPIIIFGCSFGWGHKLKDNETFHYKLSKLMKRPVYNRSLGAWGIQHMLYQLRDENFYKQFPEPEYIIYIYISNHIRRMYKYGYIENCGQRYNYNYLKYDLKKNQLVEEHRMQNLPYIRLWNQVILKAIAESKVSEEKSFELFEKHLLECKKQVEKHWKNTKFVILDFKSEFYVFCSDENILNRKHIEQLKKDGFLVIKTTDLTDIKFGDKYYISEEDQHPNEKAWDIITPLFVQELLKVQKQ